MPYQTVFEISHKPFPWWFPACGLLVVAFGCLIQKGVTSTRASKRGGKSNGWPVIVFGMLWTLAAFGGILPNYVRYNEAYRNGQYSVVDGVVEDFQPMPHQGCKCKCFRVTDVRLCYLDYNMATAGLISLPRTAALSERDCRSASHTATTRYSKLKSHNHRRVLAGTFPISRLRGSWPRSQAGALQPSRAPLPGLG